jgi:hypothetical protein
VVNSAIVWGDVVIVEKQSFLYYSNVSLETIPRGWLFLHLLKLVTGVDISTRAVNKSGKPGKEVKRRRRTAAAAPNKAAFLLSTFIINL